MADRSHCPRCNSPDPTRHPASQFQGEVQICPDAFHAGAVVSAALCYDCMRPYGDEHGFPDMIIPTAVWRRISPSGDDGGLLCPSCICARLHKAGIREVESAFFSGPIQSVSRPTMYALRQIENLEERMAREANANG